MKTLIVSDLHLTDEWDEPKARFLERLFTRADRVILNGDFWDGERIYFDAFISSRWNTLFPLLKKKGALYIYGNHDLEAYNDNRTSLFSVKQLDSYTLTFKTYSLFIEHGHQLFRTIDLALHLPRHILFHLSSASQPIESFLVRHGSIHNPFIRISNMVMKRRISPRTSNEWYICGHTHYPELDYAKRYANSGFIQHGKATYLIASSSGLKLHTEWYK
jgi:predicted phosphodiesterase